MPFKGEGKTDRCFQSPPDESERAAKYVIEEDTSYRKAAANFNSFAPAKIAKKMSVRWQREKLS